MKNFTNNFKQFTSRLSARWLLMALMMLVGTSSAWGWGYKSAGGSWNDCTSSFSSTSFYTTPTSSTASSYDILMKTKPGSGFNITQNNDCGGQKLYVNLSGTASTSSSTIVRAVAKWNNGLYCTYTVVIPDGKIYIKPTDGDAVLMTKSTYTYTAELTLSDAKTFDLYADDPGNSNIENQDTMPSAGKPTSVRLNYTNLVSDYQYVRVTYNLKTNQITFEEMTPPCSTPDAPTFEAIPAQCGSYTLPTEDKNKVSVNWYTDATDGEKITYDVTTTRTYYAEAVDGTCISASRTPVQITINTNPTISISGSEEAVLYEDVELAAATDGTSISWEITEGDGSLSSTTGNSVTLTSSSADNVTVTATATLGSCTATDTHEVEFSAENCAPIPSNDIQITFTHPAKNNNNASCQYWGFGYIFKDGVTPNNERTNYLAVFPNKDQTSGSKTVTLSNVQTAEIKVYLNAYYEYSGCRASTQVFTLQRGGIYSITISSDQQGNGNGEKVPSVTKTSSLTQDPPITAPAVNTVSVTSTQGSGVVNFTGQVVKTGCAANNKIYVGYQYKLATDEWPTTGVTAANQAGANPLELNPLGHPNGLDPFTDNIPLTDGTYDFRAYVINGYDHNSSNYDQGVYYGLSKRVTVSVQQQAITSVTIEHANIDGTTINNVPTYCAGTTAYIKLTHNGTPYKGDVVWTSTANHDFSKVAGKENLFSYIVKGEDNDVTASVKNDENDDYVSSNSLNVKVYPVPNMPNFTISKTTICSTGDDGAVITVTNPQVGITYQVYKKVGDNETAHGDAVTYSNGTLTINSIKTAGTYFVKAWNEQCDNKVERSLTEAEVTMVDAAANSIAITPTSKDVNPWMPTTFIVTKTGSYNYTLTCAPASDAIITQKGDTYIIKFPKPADAQIVDGQVTFTPIPYNVTAKLNVDVQGCGTTVATSNVTLTPLTEVCP